jgi:hypothetical protein
MMPDHSGQQIVVLTTIWCWQKYLLALSEQINHGVHREVQSQEIK